MFVWQGRPIASGQDLFAAVAGISEPEAAAEFRRAYRMALIANGVDPRVADRNVARLLEELVAAYALSLSRTFFPEGDAPGESALAIEDAEVARPFLG